jgi:hypothetical protein
MGDETKKTINFGGKLNFIMFFFFPKRLTTTTYIFIAPTI